MSPMKNAKQNNKVEFYFKTFLFNDHALGF